MEQNASDSALVELINVISNTTNERQRRIILSALSNYIGWGSQSLICNVSGVTMNTITKGKKELRELLTKPVDEWPDMVSQVRSSGAGRKSVSESNPEVIDAIKTMIEPYTLGSPTNPLIWTTKSFRNIANALNDKGFKVSHVTVGKILEELGYSLQVNQKYIPFTTPGPERDRQFRRINRFAKYFMRHCQPVISVDAKKKENVGNFKNQGAEWHKKGTPLQTFDHDYPDLKATPYGVYDTHANKGFVNVGVSADTAEFAVSSIYQWWIQMGKQMYPNATRLMITADSGGSNSCRSRLWKHQLQKLSNDTGLELFVLHYPPGTSKWNKIEHRMFSYITKNWRGRPLETVELIVNLIANCTTTKGLRILCQKDERAYEKGIKISDKALKEITIKKASWKGDWFYTIIPNITP